VRAGRGQFSVKSPATHYECSSGPRAGRRSTGSFDVEPPRLDRARNASDGSIRIDTTDGEVDGGRPGPAHVGREIVVMQDPPPHIGAAAPRPLLVSRAIRSWREPPPPRGAPGRRRWRPPQGGARRARRGPTRVGGAAPATRTVSAVAVSATGRAPTRRSCGRHAVGYSRAGRRRRVAADRAGGAPGGAAGQQGPRRARRAGLGSAHARPWPEATPARGRRRREVNRRAPPPAPVDRPPVIRYPTPDWYAQRKAL
jgi:hypothetical protein